MSTNTDPARELIGQIFGRLVVTGEARMDAQYRRYWYCVCACGTARTVRQDGLRSGNTKSCGCLHRDIVGARLRTHGQSRTPEFRLWVSMRRRCENTSDRAYANYGGRGIRVCDRWRTSFEAFITDLGQRPAPELTLERVDNNGDYEPLNVRWATRREQQNNRRCNILLTIDGDTHTAQEWSRRSGTRSGLIRWRLNNGWPATQAVFGR